MTIRCPECGADVERRRLAGDRTRRLHGFCPKCFPWDEDMQAEADRRTELAFAERNAAP